MNLSVIIPCYNEENRIGNTLERINSYLKDQTYEYEIIVVVNGSTDKTEEIVHEFSRRIPFIVLINEKERGKGRAVKRGMLYAKGKYRLFTDADNSTDISQVDKLLESAQNGYDVVISSRKISGAVIKKYQPPKRALLGKIFSFLVGIVVPLKIKDTQNGFKLFSKEAAEKIFPKQTILHYAFDIEVLALAKIFNFKIKEVPIIWRNDDRSKVKFKDMIKMILEVIQIRLRLWTNYYQKDHNKNTTELL